MKNTNIQFSVSTDIATGELKGRRNKNSSRVTYIHRGRFQHYELKVLETHHYLERERIVSYNLIVQGSLHKNFHNGTNYQRFTCNHLLKEIANICNALALPANRCKIQNMEIGANISTEFPVAPFINNTLLMHSTIPLMEYSASRYRGSLGKHAKHSQHSFKCYNKGLQYDLQYNLIRVEVRCLKMQFISKYGIKTLEDLMDQDKLKALSKVVLKGWDQVLLCGQEIDPGSLDITQSQQTLLRDGCNRDYWIRLHAGNPKKFNKVRAKFKELTKKYSGFDRQLAVRNLLIKEFDAILDTGSFLPNVNPKGDILTYPIKGKSVPLCIEETINLSKQSDLSTTLPNPTLPTVKDQDAISLYIPHETPQDSTSQQSDSPSAVWSSNPQSINPPNQLTKPSAMKQQKHSETTKTGKCLGECESTQEYTRAQENAIGSPETAIPSELSYAGYGDWLTARFMIRK